MDVKFKKIIMGFAGAGFIGASFLFWPSDSHKTALRAKPRPKHSAYQSKVMPVEKIKKTDKAQSVTELQKSELAPVAKDLQEVKPKLAVNNVRTIRNILNIKLKKETSITSSKTIGGVKLKGMLDSKATALRLKRATAIHLTQAL